VSEVGVGNTGAKSLLNNLFAPLRFNDLALIKFPLTKRFAIA